MNDYKKCGNCRNWMPSTSECRRYAPRPRRVPGVISPSMQVRWTMTGREDWCGEWQEGEEVAP